MTSLEDALRRMFAGRATSVPAVPDPAGAAIRRARAVRRQRAALGSAAAGVLAVALVTGLLAVRERLLPSTRPEPVVAMPGEEAVTLPVASPTTAAPPPRLDRIGLDLWVAHQLWTVDGRRIPLTGVGLVTRVHRVPAGWVYSGPDQLRLMRADATAIDLTVVDERWVLRPDGRRLAFMAGDVLRLADIDVGGLVDRAARRVPAGSRPVAFLGNQVVLVNAAGTGYDIVAPDQERTPAWRTDVLRVYGATSAGGVAALVRSGSRTCLAALAAGPDGLRVDRVGDCGLGLRPTTETLLSPGGRWLSWQSAAGRMLVDLPQALAGRSGTVPCAAAAAAPAAWADPATLVAAGDEGAVLCRTNGTRERAALPADLLDGWRFVPRP